MIAGPLDRDKAARKVSIAEAALRVFQRNGFSQTRVEDICAEAKIAKGTYYLYFSSKEEVLHSIFSGVMEVATSTVVLDSATDPVSRVMAIVEGLLDQGRERLDTVPVFWEVAGYRIVQSKYDLNGKIELMFRQLSEVIATILTEGQELGSVDSTLDPVAFARMITASADGIILHAALFYRDDPKFLERQRDSFVQMVRQCIQNRATVNRTGKYQNDHHP